MYSKIPMPQVEWTKESMQYCICFFPAVGAVIGAATLLWNMLVGAKLSGSLLFTAVLILIPVLITGGIHLDGLLDTADALSSYKTKEEKLEILKDSHAGAFAIIIGICWFVLDFGIYSEADAHTIGLLAIGFVISRALSGLSLVSGDDFFPCLPQDVANLLTLFHVINAAQTNDRIICCHTHHDVGMINGQTLSVYSLIGAKGHWNKVLFLAEPTQ